MFAVIFHWWLGALLTIVGIALTVGVVGGYVKKVVAPQYPGKRQKREDCGRWCRTAPHLCAHRCWRAAAR